MPRFVLLDAGPLGLACCPAGTSQEVDQCRAWLVNLETSPAGPEVIIPAIVDYEVRRENLRLRATAKLRALDELLARFGSVGVTPAALRRAAELWAGVRRAGQPTARDEDIDIDAIVAGMALTMGGLRDTVTIATLNTRHFSRFPGVRAEHWTNIAP